MNTEQEAMLCLTQHFRGVASGLELLAAFALFGNGVPGLTVTVDWCEFLGVTEAQIIDQLCVWWQAKAMALTVDMDRCEGISAELAKAGRALARTEGWQDRCRPLAARTWAAMQR